MADEQTLVMIKPDGIEIAEQIFIELDQIGRRVKTVRIPNVPIEKILAHYEEPIQRHGEFLRHNITDFFANQTIILAIYEGPRIIQRMRDKIGPTDPAKAPEGTIRGDYCNDNLETSIREGRFVRNAVHASDSPENFQYEYNVWREYLK